MKWRPQRRCIGAIQHRQPGQTEKTGSEQPPDDLGPSKIEGPIAYKFFRILWCREGGRTPTRLPSADFESFQDIRKLLIYSHLF